MDQTGIPPNYFNGWMDELRIWKVELTVEQIRQMKEIQNNNDGNVKERKHFWINSELI
jgi:hypothetical protein